MLTVKTIHENLVSLIFVLLIFGSSWAVLERKFEALEAKQEGVKQQELNNEKMSLELISQEKALAKEQQDLSAFQAEAKAKLAAADEKQRALDAKSASISVEANLVQERATIKSLEHEYTTLGVNTAGDPPCGDKERMDKYNRGKALLNEIVSRAESIHEYPSVQGFLSRSEGFSADVDPCRTEAQLHRPVAVGS